MGEFVSERDRRAEALRLVSEEAMIVATPDGSSHERDGSDGRRVFEFVAPHSGPFMVEVKVVHVNGSSEDASQPRSLGVIGIRARHVGRRRQDK